MLKIGAFSVLSQISIHMLRHYDEIGLLIPCVDQFTGYRYYSENQLPYANRIQALKDMGFGLHQIKEILCAYDDDEKLGLFFAKQADVQKDEIIKLQKRLMLLESTIHELSSNDLSIHESIAAKRIPRREVVSCRGIIPSYGHEGLLWEQLHTECKKLNVVFASPCYNIALFHDEEYRDSDVDVELQRTVVGSYPDTQKIRFQTAGEVLVAAMIYRGRYELLRVANEQVTRWIMDNHYQIAGKAFHIYHVSPETEHVPENMVTEVCIPIQSCNGT